MGKVTSTEGTIAAGTIADATAAYLGEHLVADRKAESPSRPPPKAACPRKTSIGFMDGGSPTLRVSCTSSVTRMSSCGPKTGSGVGGGDTKRVETKIWEEFDVDCK